MYNNYNIYNIRERAMNILTSKFSLFKTLILPLCVSLLLYLFFSDILLSIFAFIISSILLSFFDPGKMVFWGAAIIIIGVAVKIGYDNDVFNYNFLDFLDYNSPKVSIYIIIVGLLAEAVVMILLSSIADKKITGKNSLLKDEYMKIIGDILDSDKIDDVTKK